MRPLKSFLLGAIAIGLVAYAVAAAAAVAAQAGGRTLAVALGPIQFVSVAEQGTAVVTTFGPGLLILALAGGLSNLLAAWAVQRHAERKPDGVD